jgi:adenosylcobinamide-GDP ribazoletransferase
MLRSAIVAAQFLTRVPLSRRVVEAGELSRAVAWFPVIGALVGTGVAGVVYFAAPLLGTDVAIVAGLIFGALVTGAFHEDALADACDGLGGGTTRARALEIMRDSRVGSYGVVALVLLYAARFALFRTLGPAALLLAYPAASSLGRGSIVAVLGLLPSAREEGMGSHVARSLGRVTIAIGLATPAVIAVLLCGRAALPLVVVAIAANVLAAVYLRHRLGGATGDCAGAVNVVVEVLTLATSVAWIRLAGPLEMLPWR